jgi:TRAP-type C4-dicarboxylate transport system substrate-binding protein
MTLFKTISKTTVIGSLMAVALSTSSLSYAATTWNMPTPYGDGVHHTKNVYAFAEEVKAKTNGELNIVVHSGGSLFKHPEIHRAVKTGQVNIGEIFMGILGNEDPIFKLDNIPFLASNFAQARALWDASRDEIQKSLATDGLQLLYAVPWPPQGIYTKDPVASITDLEGLKMRAYSPSTSRLSVLLKSAPTTVQTPEIPQAFGTGIINAMVTSPSTGVSSQAWDFVENYTDVQAWIPKNMVLVYAKAFNRLSESTQKAVLQAAATAESRGWDMAAKETSVKTNMLAENGMYVSQPGKELTADLENIGNIMANEWIEESGQRGTDVLAKYKK